MNSTRRSVIARLFSTIAGLAGYSLVAQSQTPLKNDAQLLSTGASQDVTLYPGSIRYGNMVFVSGTGADAESVFEIKADTDFVLKKMEKRLLAAGSSMEKVLKVTIFLSDMSLFGQVNEVYGSYFTGNYPARETVAVKGLPKGVNVEISVTALQNL